MDQVGTGHPSFALLSAYHDGEATPAERLALGGHLDRCAACRRTLAGFDLLGLALRADPTPSCADLQRLLSAALDGETRPEESAVAASHLAGCAACRADRAAWQALDLAIAALPAAAPSAAADARIRGLAHRRRLLPSGPQLGGGLAGRLAAAAVALALAIVAALPPGAAVAPPVATGEERPLVASVQQVLNPTTNTLYVLRPADAVVVARNATTNAPLAEISVGGRPTALALNETANLIYVLDPSAKTYTTISGDTNTVTATAAVPLSGTLTTIQVNQATGQVVIGASATAAPSAAPGQLAIIDPASQRLETHAVDVAPTQVVLSAAANRMYLLGAKGTSVLDATSYATIATLPAAVAVAASATGGPDAILGTEGGRAKLTFYGATASATFDGTPVNAVGLPDGSFALLLDVGGSGRIELVDRLGGAIGSLDVVGTAKALTFDPDGRRFLGPNGQVVATISGTTIALAPAATAAPTSPTPTPVPAAPTVAPRSATPPASAPSILAPARSAPPSGPVPGAAAAAIGLARLPTADGVVPAIVAGGGERIWLVDQSGILRFVDTRSGAMSAVSVLGPAAAIARLAVTPATVYALDTASATLFAFHIDSGALSAVSVPFGRSVSALAVAPDGRVWLAASGYSGLLVHDPRTGRFDLVPLGGVSVSALATDLAGQIWFVDATNGRLDRYDPASARLTQLGLPADEAFVALRADLRGGLWLGTTSGALYRLSGDALSRVANAGAPIVSFAPAPDGTLAVLAAGAQYTLAGPAGGLLTSAPAGVRSFAVDASGRLWLADRTQPLFYIAEPR